MCRMEPCADHANLATCLQVVLDVARGDEHGELLKDLCHGLHAVSRGMRVLSTANMPLGVLLLDPTHTASDATQMAQFHARMTGMQALRVVKGPGAMGPRQVSDATALYAAAVRARGGLHAHTLQVLLPGSLQTPAFVAALEGIMQPKTLAFMDDDGPTLDRWLLHSTLLERVMHLAVLAGPEVTEQFGDLTPDRVRAIANRLPWLTSFSCTWALSTTGLQLLHDSMRGLVALSCSHITSGACPRIRTVSAPVSVASRRGTQNGNPPAKCMFKIDQLLTFPNATFRNICVKVWALRPSLAVARLAAPGRFQQGCTASLHRQQGTRLLQPHSLAGIQRVTIDMENHTHEDLPYIFAAAPDATEFVLTSTASSWDAIESVACGLRALPKLAMLEIACLPRYILWQAGTPGRVYPVGMVKMLTNVALALGLHWPRLQQISTIITNPSTVRECNLALTAADCPIRVVECMHMQAVGRLLA